MNPISFPPAMPPGAAPQAPSPAYGKPATNACTSAVISWSNRKECGNEAQVGTKGGRRPPGS